MQARVEVLIQSMPMHLVQSKTTESNKPESFQNDLAFLQGGPSGGYIFSANANIHNQSGQIMKC